MGDKLYLWDSDYDQWQFGEDWAVVARRQNCNVAVQFVLRRPPIESRPRPRSRIPRVKIFDMETA